VINYQLTTLQTLYTHRRSTTTINPLTTVSIGCGDTLTGSQSEYNKNSLWSW